MNIESINILRRNGHIVWTRESGLPYPTDWAIADARPIRQEAPVRDAASFAIKAPAEAFDLGKAVLEQVRLNETTLEDVRATQTGTKLSRALIIYNSDVKADRQSIIARFMSELSMSKAGATTYYHTCSRR